MEHFNVCFNSMKGKDYKYYPFFLSNIEFIGTFPLSVLLSPEPPPPPFLLMN